MLSNLKDKFTSLIDSFRNSGILTESKISDVLKKIENILLEADITVDIVERFSRDLKEKILGVDQIKGITTHDQVIKTVHDELVKIVNVTNPGLDQSPSIIMAVGLQGHGKTTTLAKLAKHLSEKDNIKKILVVSFDIYRPAAQQQLQQLCNSIDNVEFLDHGFNEIESIIHKISEIKGSNKYDYILCDTAGRLHTDEQMIQELLYIQKNVSVNEVLLVVNSTTGIASADIAARFSHKLNINGVIMTRLDADTKGGSIFNVSYSLKVPIKFICNGEHLGDITQFNPERFVARLLGSGDIVALVEKASKKISEQDVKKSIDRIKSGAFTMADYLSQLEQINNLGFMKNISAFLPESLKKMLNVSKLNDNKIKQQIAIIRSMTPKERNNHKILNISRKKRIASGAAVNIKMIDQLIKQYDKISSTFKKLSQSDNLPTDLGGIQDMIKNFS